MVSAVAVTERFVDLAKAVAESRGVPDLPLLILPASIENLSEDEIALHSRDLWAQLLRQVGSSAEGH